MASSNRPSRVSERLIAPVNSSRPFCSSAARCRALALSSQRQWYRAENLTEHAVRLVQRVVELQGLPCRRLRLRNRLVGENGPPQRNCIWVSASSACASAKSGCDGHGLLEIGDRPAERVMLLLAPGRQSFEIRVVRLRGDRP